MNRCKMLSSLPDLSRRDNYYHQCIINTKYTHTYFRNNILYGPRVIEFHLCPKKELFSLLPLFWWLSSSRIYVAAKCLQNVLQFMLHHFLSLHLSKKFKSCLTFSTQKKIISHFSAVTCVTSFD